MTTCKFGHPWTVDSTGRSKQGHRYCKPCKAAGTRKWRVQRREVDLEGFQERDRQRAKNYARDLRKQILNAYANKCACCGEAEEIFLALDHVNNDGAQHRRELTGNRNSGSSVRVYADVKRQGFPMNFQLLCHNCNFAKSRGGCPHVS